MNAFNPAGFPGLVHVNGALVITTDQGMNFIYFLGVAFCYFILVSLAAFFVTLI